VNHPVAPPDRPLEAVARELAEANARLKQTNEELARLYEKSRDMDELKSRFFANVSHELRTPLTLILGPVARRLATKSVPPEERRELEIIDRNARLLLHHVTDLLDVARLEAGRMRMSYAEFDLALLVRLVSSHFETLGRRAPHPLRRRHAGRAGGPGGLRQGASNLLNLLSNAFKSTPYGGVISVWLQARADQATIGVQDSGPGVPPAMREAIFEPFRRADAEGRACPRRHRPGTGRRARISPPCTADRLPWRMPPAAGALFTVSLPLSPRWMPASGGAGRLRGSVGADARRGLARAAGRGDRHPAARIGQSARAGGRRQRRHEPVHRGRARRHYRVATAFDGKEGSTWRWHFSPT